MVEKWLFRMILAALGMAILVSVVGSLDDIKRYAKIRQM